MSAVEPPRLREIGAADPAAAAAALIADGAVVMRGLAAPGLVAAMRAALERCVAEDNQRFGAAHRFPGMVHALPVRDPVFLEYLALPGLRHTMQLLLGHGCIVHACNASSVPPGDTNYARAIHVDAPRWVADYMTNAGCILALDPFTQETGAMEILADGFRHPEPPALDVFEARCARPTMQPGDALFFNARSWHRAGVNRTPRWRHGVTINVCRAFMRQQFDFPRLLDAQGVAVADEALRQFLGWHVRMPTSLEEFLLPADQRPYRPGQE